MAKLSDQEQALLKKLQSKMDSPDPPGVSSVSIQLNLGDEKQVSMARRLGILPSDDDESEDDGGEGNADDPEDADEVPKRRGYFQ